MKKIALMFLASLTFAGTLSAQQSENLNKEKMQPLLSWVGRWQGEGSMYTNTGELRKSAVDEHIESKLDGVVLLIEGIGKFVDPSTKKEIIAHHALAVLSYDQNSNQYKFKTYLKDGKSADAWFNVIAENTYQWGFDTKTGKIRYNITLNPAAKTWNETGEYSADGNTWKKFFEMNLTKTE
jgi:hypothetical protein